jgi:hypothetical protein
MVRSDAGEVSSVIAIAGAPMRRSVLRAGSPDVADAAITTGALR